RMDAQRLIAGVLRFSHPIIQFAHPSGLPGNRSGQIRTIPTLRTTTPARDAGTQHPCRSRGAVSVLRNIGPEACEAATALEETVARPAREQGSMYHICPPERQIQLRRSK